MPPNLLTCIWFLYKVVHKIGRLRKFKRAREIEWGLCEYVIVHRGTILGGSPIILWISVGGKPKWLPLVSTRSMSALRAGHSLQFPLCSSSRHQSPFLCHTIPVWNNLPSSVVSSSSFVLFQRSVRDHFAVNKYLYGLTWDHFIVTLLYFPALVTFFSFPSLLLLLFLSSLSKPIIVTL